MTAGACWGDMTCDYDDAGVLHPDLEEGCVEHLHVHIVLNRTSEEEQRHEPMEGQTAPFQRLELGSTEKA